MHLEGEAKKNRVQMVTVLCEMSQDSEAYIHCWSACYVDCTYCACGCAVWLSYIPSGQFWVQSSSRQPANARFPDLGAYKKHIQRVHTESCKQQTLSKSLSRHVM